MNQDGSDGKTAVLSGGGTTQLIAIKISTYDNMFVTETHSSSGDGLGLKLPRAMSLSLLDTENKVIRSELVPFMRSYNETVRCSVEAFSETLPANPPRDSITLVYRLRDVDGSISWLGLRSARRSEYTWMLLLADGSDIVRIGVLFDKQYIAPAMFGPIIDKNGKRIDARFTSIWILKWVGEDSDKCPVPPTYEECLDYILTHLTVTCIPDITRDVLRLVVQLKIKQGLYGKYDIFDPADYREIVQKYAYHLGSSLVVSFQIDADV